MRFLELYLFFLLSTKMWFAYAVVHNRMHPSERNKDRIEVSDGVFKAGVAALMLYLFRPNAPSPVLIEGETKLFLFIFAVLTVFDFFKHN